MRDIEGPISIVGNMKVKNNNNNKNFREINIIPYLNPSNIFCSMP